VSWYEEQFRAAPTEALAIGEASTSYTKYPWVTGVPERISSVLGEVRLIYVLRDPVERMRSQYLHHVATGQEWRPIEQAFREEPMYLNISRYAFQLDQYEPFIQRDRILVIDSRDLRDDRLPTLRGVFAFLGVEPGWVPRSVDREFLTSAGRRMKPSSLRALRRIPRIRTIATYVPEPMKTMKHRLTGGLATQELDVERGRISEALRDELERSLRPDVTQLRRFLGRDFDGWGIG
jgi:hypothetical protein